MSVETIAETTYDLPEEVENQPTRYRKVSALASASLLCGALGWAAAFDWWLMLVPSAGIALGLWALARIDRFPDELTGVGVAKAGMILSGVFGVACLGWLIYLTIADTPPGYYPISYEMLKPLPGSEKADPPPVAMELDGKRVFIKGYMYPGRQARNIEEFLLVPTVTHCQFCMPDIKPTDLVQVNLIHGIKARFTQRRRGVGGIFRLRTKDDKNPLLYRIEADYLR